MIRFACSVFVVMAVSSLAFAQTPLNKTIWQERIKDAEKARDAASLLYTSGDALVSIMDEHLDAMKKAIDARMFWPAGRKTLALEWYGHAASARNIASNFNNIAKLGKNNGDAALKKAQDVSDQKPASYSAAVEHADNAATFYRSSKTVFGLSAGMLSFFTKARIVCEELTK